MPTLVNRSLDQLGGELIQVGHRRRVARGAEARTFTLAGVSTAAKVTLGVIAGLIVGGLALVAVIAVIALLLTPQVVVDGAEPTSAGDRYCSNAKEDEIAALELSSGETINDPELLRRATRRFVRSTDDAPKGAWCVDQETQFLIDIWNSSRGEQGSDDAARQVKRLRAHP